MLRSNSRSLGNHVVSPEEEKERRQWEGFAEKKGFKSAMHHSFTLWTLIGSHYSSAAGGVLLRWTELLEIAF